MKFPDRTSLTPYKKCLPFAPCESVELLLEGVQIRVATTDKYGLSDEINNVPDTPHATAYRIEIKLVRQLV